MSDIKVSTAYFTVATSTTDNLVRIYDHNLQEMLDGCYRIEGFGELCNSVTLTKVENE